MRTVGLAPALALAGGCNLIWGLDEAALAPDAATVEVDAPPPDAVVCVPTDPHDEDGDGRADECDLCPHLADDADVDADDDGVGDPCDPRPGLPDRLERLITFATEPTGWVFARGTWSHVGDAITQADLNAPTTLAYLDDLALPADATIDVGLLLGESVAGAPPSIGVWGWASAFDATQAEPDGYLCELRRTTSNATFVALDQWSGGTETELEARVFPDTFLAGTRYRLRLTRDRRVACAAHLEITSDRITADDLTHTSGALGVRTSLARVTVEYVAVYVTP